MRLIQHCNLTTIPLLNSDLQSEEASEASPVILERKNTLIALLYLVSDLYMTFILNSTSPILNQFFFLLKIDLKWNFH